MANVRFGTAKNGTVLLAFLSGEIDHHTAQRMRLEIDTQVQSMMPQVLTMDFTGVGFMDSSGIGLILGRARRMEALDGQLVVQHPPQQIQKMLDLAQVAYV